MLRSTWGLAQRRGMSPGHLPAPRPPPPRDFARPRRRRTSSGHLPAPRRRVPRSRTLGPATRRGRNGLQGAATKLVLGLFTTLLAPTGAQEIWPGVGHGSPRARPKGERSTPLRVLPAKQAWPPTPSRPGALSTADSRTGLRESPVTLGTESCDNSVSTLRGRPRLNY